MQKPNKKTVIISSVGGILAAAAVSFAVRFSLPRELPIDTTSASAAAISSESVTETVTETEATTESTTEAPTEATTQKVKKPPAAPVTKPYKPKPTNPTPKPSVPQNKTVKLNVPTISQLPKYPTGCEAASATMLLKYYGYNITLDEMVNAIPREDLYEENGRVYGPSIYEKFVGDPRQTYTDERPGYGAFSPVITRSLNNVLAKKNGRHKAKNITGCSFSSLIKNLDSGDPVIVWATARMKTPTLVNSWYIKNADGTDRYFEYPRGTHVMVLTGYDGTYVYVNDPYYGALKFTYQSFSDKWELLGKQAIVLESGTPPTETTTAPTTTETTTGESTTEEPAETATEVSTETEFTPA